MRPQADESLLGYIKRRSDAEGFPDASSYLTMLGQAYGRAAFEKADDLATALDLEMSMLEPLLPGSETGDPALSWPFHRMHRDPVCPKCSAARGPRRKEWRHQLVSACAEHGFRLIDRCPGCRGPLTLTGDGYAGCLCGADYGAAEIEAATPMEIEVARLVAGRTSRLAGVDLEQEDALDAVPTLWFLSSYLARARTGKEGKGTRPRTLEETRDLLASVEPLLMKWPEVFDDHVRARWDAPGAEGLTAAARLGSWYRGLQQQKGLLGGVLRSRCIAVVGTVCGDTYKTSRHVEGSSWVSAAEAGRLLGIRADRIAEAARSGVIEAKQGRSGTGHRHTIVRTADVSALQQLRYRTATKERVRALLGVSRKQFELMEEADFFGEHCRAEQHPCVTGTYDLEQIRIAVDQVLKLAQRCAEPGEETVMFRDISLRRTTDRAALLELYRHIAARQLIPLITIGPTRLAEARFNARDVNSVLQLHGGANLRTAAEVARVWGWKAACVTGWCEQGLLQATRGRRGALEVWQITDEAIARFQREFHVVADLAGEGRTTSRRLLASLAERGVTSVGCIADGGASRGHLILARDLAQILAAKPHHPDLHASYSTTPR
jgi:hypothetical protein